MRLQPPAGWRWTAAWYRLIGAAALTLGLGVAVGRADVVVLGAPFLLMLLVGALAPKPVADEPLSVTSSPAGALRQGVPAPIRVTLTGAEGAQWATISLPTPDGRPLGRLVAVPPGSASRHDLVAETGPVNWGRVALSRPDAAAVGADGLTRNTPAEAALLEGHVLPDVPRVDGLALPPILGGWSGEHPSRRAGQGNELIDLREYQAGDRLRSIHWRAYARHQKLFVRRTESSADAEFVLCLDTRHDIGPERQLPRSRNLIARQSRVLNDWWGAAARWGRMVVGRPAVAAPPTPSSLDLLVAATSAIAATQLRAGDRVGVLDLAAPGRHLQMGTGTRHLQRIREQLSTLTPSNAAFVLRADQWRLPAGAVVLLCSTLADDEPVRAALEVRARGHRVQLIDVLPVHALRRAADRRWSGPGERAARNIRVAALELTLAEREARLDRLRAAGLPILRWEDDQLGTDIRVARRTLRDRR